jgi:hypothetical protein
MCWCVGHHYAQTNTNNVNKTLALIQTTGGKDEPNIVTVREPKLTIVSLLCHTMMALYTI